MEQPSSGGGGSALLLRLFESDFFDVHLCVAYLKNYPHSIGITHYLVNRLRAFAPDDVEFYWPQLCYLVITRPTPSVALENFILERCESDAHIAVITLWYLQSSLSDLSSMPKSEQFAVCRRVYNRVQAIIFTDPPTPPPMTPESIVNDVSVVKTPSKEADSVDTRLPPTKLNAPTAMFVGLGILVASIAMPRLASTTGKVAVEQARRVDQITKSDPDAENDVDDNSASDEDLPLVKTARSTAPGAKSKPPATSNGISRKNGLPTLLGDSSRRASTSKLPSSGKRKPSYVPGAPIEASSASSASAFLSALASHPQSKSHTFLPTTTTSLLSTSGPAGDRSRSTTTVGRALTTVTTKKSGWANDPATASPLLGRRRQSAFHPHPFSSSSVPSLHVPSPAFINNPSSSFLSGVTTPGYGLPPAFLSKLLLLQACRSQLDLLRSLQDISTRLVLVPKPARLSSLRAELTVLNHGLPRGCSLGMPSRNYHPLAPPSSDKLQKRIQFKPQARIVRISPSESVVLNSADRAPFVIHVEVLETDLDFDPDRRQNAEDLRRALQEREGRSSSAGGGGGAVKGNGHGHGHGHGLVGATGSLTNDFSGARKNSLMVSRGSFDHALERQRFSSAGASSPSLLTSSLSKEVPALSPPRTTTSKVPRVPDNEGDISLAPSETSKSSTSEQQFETETFEEPEGEMDLVEQLYGDVSIHDAPFSPREVEEEEIHNRSVDEQAWARASTPTATGSLAEETLGLGMIDRSIDRPLTPTSSYNTRPPLSASASSSPVVPSWSKPGGRSVSSRPAISIDDYADRMRMAAVMLAQLDASQAATRGVVAKGTAAAGTLVGLPVATVAGIGGVVGAGLGAVASRLPFGSNKVAATGAALSTAAALNPEGQVGQASSGTTTTLDTTSAADGTSAVAGQPPLINGPTMTPTPSAPQTRARLLAPAEATMIRERIMSEMMALEEERMARMREDGRARSGWTHAVSSTGSGALEDGAVVMRAVNKDDPSGAVFRESFADKTARIRAASPYGHLANWNVISVIVKTGADLRQEQFAIQLVKEFGRIWVEEKCPSWVCYFRILVTSEQSGLMETITDAVSIHSIKKDAYTRTAADGTQVFTSFTLYDHFVDTYGPPSSGRFRKAQDAFVKSLASYSVICYLLQLKDRHNGNILVDRDGHLIHIDFGFLLSNSPGSLGFEMAPFKLPQDYIDILGGYESDKFLEFKHLFKRAFRAARKHAERIITLVELMQKDSKLDCFANGELTSQQLRERFMLSLTSTQIDEYSEKLIINAATSSFTRLYDLFQGYSNGIL